MFRNIYYYLFTNQTCVKVHWQRTTFDLSSGTIHERVVQISIDLDIVDNTKWSIEKPTPYTWRLRIRSLAYTDEGNYTCYVPLSDKMNRAESNRTVFAFGTHFSYCLLLL